MPLKVPDDLKEAIVNVKGENDTMWVVWGYANNKTLKLVKTGEGDLYDLCAVENLCQDSELHYALMNSPDGVKVCFVEWTGPTVNGMKRSYVLRNKGEIDKLIGYVHHRFASEDRDSLIADIHKIGVYEGEKTIGHVAGWDPSIEEWRALWAQTDPVNGWDPSSIWIYKWNPYGDLSFGNLPEEDKKKLKKLYKFTEGIPEEIVSKGLKEKLKKLAEATCDEEIPDFTEDEMIDLARVVGMYDIVEARNKGNETHKIEKKDLPKDKIEKKPKKEPKKVKPVAPPPEEEPKEEKKTKKLEKVPAPEDDVPTPEDEDPEAIPEAEEEEPQPEEEEAVEPESDEDDPDDAPVEKCYFIYTTSLGQNANTASQVYQIKMILDLHQIKYEEVDLYIDGLEGGTRRQEMYARSGTKVLPQIFINDEYLEGGFEEFMWMNELGEL